MLKKGLMITFLLCFMAGAICFYREVSQAVLAAGSRCVQVLIPSLYLYSVLAAWYVESGCSTILAIPIDRFSKRFLRMDGELLLVFLFSQCGGYPVGIQMLEGLRRSGRITAEQEGQLACVCMGSGPAFLLGTVCSRLEMPDWMAGMLWLSLFLPNLVLALWLASRGTFQLLPVEKRPFLTTGGFTTAVEHAAAAMLKLCGMVLLFSGGIAIWQALGGFAHFPSDLWKTGFSAALEISSITEFLSAGGSLPWTGAFLSFGGICVHCQLSAIAGGRLPWGVFWLIRVLAAGGSWLLCYGGLQILGTFPTAVWKTEFSAYVLVHSPAQSAAVLCLLLMSVMLLKKSEQHSCRIHSTK